MSDLMMKNDNHKNLQKDVEHFKKVGKIPMCSDKAAIKYDSVIRKTQTTKENTSYHDNEFPQENL